MDPAGTRSQDLVAQFSKLVAKVETVGEELDETRQIIFHLRRLTSVYQVTISVLEKSSILGLM